jgi:Cys-rich four helix bundle protein (predicted Tat secretion target)
MQRRALMTAAAAATAAFGAMAQTQPKPKAKAADAHAHHHHGGGGKYDAVMQSAAHCVMTGETCLAHCHIVLAEGEKDMAECAKSVNELVAVCAALRSLAAQNAPRLPALAKVAIDTCLACEKECRKHEKKHSQCKDCADACKACADDCRKVAS